ncbi:MAG: selenium cofactor biosynthesis protein YqeC [Anaerolineae bacterium]
MDLNRALRIQPKEVVAFVGGGGKTSAMFRLADELVAQGQRVVTTTTTRIFAAQIALAPQHIIHRQDQPPHELIASLTRQLASHPHMLVIGEPDYEIGKAFGVEPSLVAAIASIPEVDIILTEADGSRMRPLKAPAGHEPVVPDCTTLLVPVVGVEALSHPLTDRYVHRAALVAELAGVKVGAEVTPEIVATVLTHPQGGLKGLPPRARAVPLINKVESPRQLAAARDLARRLMAHQRVDAVVIAAVQREDPVTEVHGRVAAIVLAGGASQRFGAPKQLLPWEGGSLLGHVADTALASRASPVVVVLGHQADACQVALGDRPVTAVVNPDWAQGQSTSVRAGLAALQPNVSAALFLLVDQPRITPAVINALIERHRATLAPVVWPEHNGRRGNPVLFDHALFPQLARLSGDTGGRPVLQAYADRAERVPVSDPGVLFDIDTPGDYQKAVGNPSPQGQESGNQESGGPDDYPKPVGNPSSADS